MATGKGFSVRSIAARNIAEALHLFCLPVNDAADLLVAEDIPPLLCLAGTKYHSRMPGVVYASDFLFRGGKLGKRR